jgi:hypothetical protein
VLSLSDDQLSKFGFDDAVLFVGKIMIQILDGIGSKHEEGMMETGNFRLCSIFATTHLILYDRLD